ncbi:MAG: hypothetical protein ACTSRI_04690 [Promethearchaeota archaeon]
MKRLKSIDIFRGLCIFYMTFGHMIEWFILRNEYWLYEIVWNFGAPIGGGGFLLVSGVSAAISYKSRLLKANQSQEFNLNTVRNEYLIRALLIFFISIIWNFLAVLFMNVPGIWLWFVIQTISISLIMAWPLLKTSKLFRIFLCFATWIANEFILTWLLPYQGQETSLGFLFYFLYNTPDQNIILGYFPFLLMGTVIGETLFEIFNIEDQNERKELLKKKMFIPSVIGGTILVIFGIIYLFPNFNNKTTFSSHMFILGIEFLLISFLIYLKDYGKFKFKKNYKVIYYYSFYSFTIFLAHDLIFFLFPPQFNAVEIWFYVIPIMILWTLLFRFIYKKCGKYASLKFFISKIAADLSNRIEIARLDKLKVIKTFE